MPGSRLAVTTSASKEDRELAAIQLEVIASCPLLEVD
jgi:hypothetical protein